MSTFRDRVTNHIKFCKELPLVHTSKCETLSEISRSHSLIPQHCEIFNEPLIYFFYGRPAYRPSKISPYLNDPIPLCPICLVFKPRTVSTNVHRVFPCDSGAVSRNIFDAHIKENDRDNLELEPDIKSAKQLVNMLFENNGNYMAGTLTLNNSFSKGSLEERFVNLISEPQTEVFDDRRSAIEVQVEESESLKKRLLYVVLPRELLADYQVKNTIINIWKTEPIPYPTFRGSSPAEYYSVIRDRVFQDFIESKRL